MSLVCLSWEALAVLQEYLALTAMEVHLHDFSGSVTVNGAVAEATVTQHVEEDDEHQ